MNSELVRSVLVVDDHLPMREELAAMIDRQPDLAVCGSVASIKEARVIFDRSPPDLLVVDLTLPDGSGLEFIKDVRAWSPDLAIVVLSMQDEAIFAKRSLQAGANAYVMKGGSGGELLRILRAALGGGRHVSAAMSQHLLSRMSASSPPAPCSPLERLSDRELEVFEQLGHGKQSGEIAQLLGLSTRTVEGHRAQILKKLGLPNGMEVVERASRWVTYRELQW